MKNYKELKNLIAYHARNIVNYKDRSEIKVEDHELFDTLSQAFLQFLPLVSLCEQYDNTVKEVFLTAYDDNNIGDLDDYCGLALCSIYNRYYGYISDAYKEAVTALNLATEVLKACTSCYHQAKAECNVFAEELAKLLPWTYLVTGDVSPDSEAVYDMNNEISIIEFAKKRGFYPAQDK